MQGRTETDGGQGGRGGLQGVFPILLVHCLKKHVAWILCFSFFFQKGESQDHVTQWRFSLSHTQTHKYAQTDNKSDTKKVKLGCVQWITVHFHCWSLTPPHRWRHGYWRKLICFKALFPDLSSPLALMWFQSRLKTSWFLHFSASCHSGWNRTDIERIFSAPRYIKEHQNISSLSKKCALILTYPTLWA